MDLGDIAAITGLIVALVSAYVALKNSKTSARESDVEILRGLIRELQVWREDAKERIAELECEVKEWKAYAIALCDWVRE